MWHSHTLAGVGAVCTADPGLAEMVAKCGMHPRPAEMGVACSAGPGAGTGSGMWWGGRGCSMGCMGWPQPVQLVHRAR